MIDADLDAVAGGSVFIGSFNLSAFINNGSQDGNFNGNSVVSVLSRNGNGNGNHDGNITIIG